ncbi:hypothetical protein K435DRAFT_964292 [Dendrothele bispora CBS 962.96]|uniref:Plastocyanin-like domain-containing protein n=1 Tax=Dendrothele bispora (strain CBS 962.96) TaxID=1314807 RepID=A0A4S8MBD7_DENBC|nr:hypothetical protein K435DRAFT_964292 [Dendrothele bispora CBS 962.96]
MNHGNSSDSSGSSPTSTNQALLLPPKLQTAASLSITTTSGTRFSDIVYPNKMIIKLEVDRVNHEQLEVKLIQIFAGQRYSFILNADQMTIVLTTGFCEGINSAILRYSGVDEDLEPGTLEVDAINALVQGDLVVH